MKNKKIKFVLYLLLGIHLVAFAQVPGYQGKRLNVSYDFNSYYNAFKLLHLSEVLGYSSEEEWTAPRLSIKNGISAEYVLSRHSSLVLNTSLFVSRIPTEETFYYTTDYDYWYGYDTYEILPVNETKMSAFHVGLSYRFYNPRKGLAPLGNYFQLGFEKVGYRIKASEYYVAYDYYDLYYPMYNEIHDISNSIPVKVQNSYGAYIVSCGIGTQRAIYKNFTLHYGIKMGWTFGELFNQVSNYDLDENNYIEYTSKHHLWKKNLMNVDLGIGYLIK